MKIGIQLIASFSLIAVLVLLIGLVSTTQSEEALKESIGSNSEKLAKEAMTAIDKEIHSRLIEIQKQAQCPMTRKEIINSNKEFSLLPNREEYTEKKDEAWKQLSLEEGEQFGKQTDKKELSADDEEEIILFSQSLMNNSLTRLLKSNLELEEYYQEKVG